ncbi:MAG: hypothetical protein U0N60_04500 [Oscillospiraceae bacterium]
MGRFTKHLENAEVGVDCTKCKADWAKAHRGKDMGSCTALYCRNRLKNRLAAYEDTGLTPEQCENAKVIIESAFSDDTSKAERIRELLKADKAGRVVVLPCKVGDVVYGFHGEKTILPMVAKWIETNTDGWCIAVQYTPMAPRFYRFSDFGKTVFLTREEAEKALEARKDGDKTDL